MKKSRKEKEGPDADLVTALKSEITKAKAVDTKNYTEESVKVLNDTISEAEKSCERYRGYRRTGDIGNIRCKSCC